MSHSVVMIVVPDAASVEAAKHMAERALEPFNENTAVEPYRDYLNGDRVARMRAHYEQQEGRALTLAELAAFMQDWDGDEGGVDERGLYRISTYNPQSRWDWYEIGGRWAGEFASDSDPDPNVLRAETFDALAREYAPFALLTPDGVWHERGRMGWFGMASDEKEADVWRAEFAALLAPWRVPGVALVVVDVHI